MTKQAKRQWGLITVAALVIELVLFAILVPVLVVFGTPVALVIIRIGVVFFSFILTF